MITIFNRRELICTPDMIIQAKVREILETNNIDYIINPVTSFAMGDYKIYVKKTDIEEAGYLIKDIYK